MPESETLSFIEIVDHDRGWAGFFEQEREALASRLKPPFIAHEHIGSTAVPGLRAKPIIDMIASLTTLPAADALTMQLHAMRYDLVETGIKGRRLYRKQAMAGAPMFHLHVVAHDSWAGRKERLMRDYLRSHPDAALRYGWLKDRLSEEYSGDSLAYTRAKTAFIQEIMDALCDETGRPRFGVWND